MGDQISERRARVPNEKAEDLPLHVGQVVAALPQHPVLLGPEEMHDSVDGRKDVIGQRAGLLDMSDVHAGHVDILNRFSLLEKSIFRRRGTQMFQRGTVRLQLRENLTSYQ